MWNLNNLIKEPLILESARNCIEILQYTQWSGDAKQSHLSVRFCYFVIFSQCKFTYWQREKPLMKGSAYAIL